MRIRIQNHSGKQPVNFFFFFAERLVDTDTKGHATPDKQGKKRDKKSNKGENRPINDLERVLNGNVAGHSLDGKRARG